MLGVKSDLSELVRDPLRLYIGCLIIQKPEFEGFEGSEGSGVMLGWIVLLIGMNTRNGMEYTRLIIIG
jgi:hypothetical protein